MAWKTLYRKVFYGHGSLSHAGMPTTLFHFKLLFTISIIIYKTNILPFLKKKTKHDITNFILPKFGSFEIPSHKKNYQKIRKVSN